MKGLDYTKPLSLYIHVPFCTRKCDYCAFYSVPLASADRSWMEKFVSLVIAEIEALNKDFGKPYRTVFIGGGNPGVIGYGNIRRIIEKTQENGRSEEVTIEINPENVSKEIYSLFPLLTRVSVGIQSMDDDVLLHLGRNARRRDNLRALSILSESPFRWNADIITAVPGESVETTLSDIESVASFSPGHISFYCLTFEEGTPLIEREAPIGEEAEAVFLEKGWARLRELGYEHYEISNFAKPGERCLHNLVYWNLGQYVGFGPGAESSVGYAMVTSMRESETIAEYLSSPALMCTPLSLQETEEEYLLAALRTKDGIDKAEYEKRFGHSFSSVYSDAISRIDKDSYIDSNESFALIEKGFMTLDWIILEMAMGL